MLINVIFPINKKNAKIIQKCIIDKRTLNKKKCPLGGFTFFAQIKQRIILFFFKIKFVKNHCYYWEFWGKLSKNYRYYWHCLG